MKNKKKKGFTLIELLAIIVILAIIAVITVPIILNIIDNSRKGAATDSAYGYKNAVHTSYVDKLSTYNDLKLDGTYTVGNDGTLSGDFNDSEVTSLPITVSGTIPTGGSLTYANNVLTSGCLTIGDYAVTFNGNETSTVKGNCSSSNEQGGTTPSTVKPVIYASKGSTQTKNVSAIAVGDYVKLGDDGFYVINTNRNGNVVLMSEYNLKNSSNETASIAPSNNGIMLMSNRTYLADNTESVWRQAYTKTASGSDFIIEPDDSYYSTSFSQTHYWGNCVATSSDSSYSCDTPYRNLYTNEAYGFIYDSNSNLYTPMENYKDYLETTTGLTLTVRPMSYDEAKSIISNSWAYSQAYWLGSEGNHGGSYHVWYVASNGSLDGNYYDYNYGVRPVIEISISNF